MTSYVIQNLLQEYERVEITILRNEVTVSRLAPS